VSIWGWLIFQEILHSRIIFEPQKTATAPGKDSAQWKIQIRSNFGEGSAEVNALADNFLLFGRECFQGLLNDFSGFIGDDPGIRGGK
jgi:hypothetical protein